MQPFVGITTFGRQAFTRDLIGCDVAVMGVPFDGTASYRSGTRFGPRAIREQSLLLWGYNNALQVAPFDTLKMADYGDVDVIAPDILETFAAIEKDAQDVLAAGCRLLTLGGEHSITLPLLGVHSIKHGPMAVVHFDAHPDTWDFEYPNQPHSHGTPFRRALERNHIAPNAYVQIGIRGPTSGPRDYADAIGLGARMVTYDEAARRGVDDVLQEVRQIVGQRPLYVSFDIDAVDPAFAPGTGTPEVGGFTSYEAQRFLRGLRGLNLIGADLVEVSPPYDHGGITAILAANLAFEILSLMALKKRAP